MNLKDLYINFFVSKGHKQIPSSPVVPENDPSVLFNTAGMQPLIPYLMGQSHPYGKRLCDYQKCIRTNDIDEVGDTYHHTFFEMLGNFSIGDYFREEAVTWGWELLTSPEWFGFDKDLLYVTVYPSDKETYDLWIKLGVKPEHIVKLEYNFWEIGEGPCGPNTEIFFDRGPKYDPENIGLRLLEEDIENDRSLVKVHNKLKEICNKLCVMVAEIPNSQYIHTSKVQEELADAGYNVVKVPGRIFDYINDSDGILPQHILNYMNGIVHENKNGDLVYITNKSNLNKYCGITDNVAQKIGFDFQTEFINSVKDYIKPENIYFVDSKMFLKNYEGGIHCLVAEMPKF